MLVTALSIVTAYAKDCILNCARRMKKKNSVERVRNSSVALVLKSSAARVELMFDV